ncbi:hypothetical protein [Chryseobacterium koreense]|uniref:Uncharacterized protein n=1 Tax=Chryseobacterium koreense CCUG 49689 TaxID=1304281 RepID=A0A0J7IZE0_9FLAO|nr:hypothetical protein [Chryseobacterium koreense]KMQ71186.1 hypothetical protein ACM44_08395 [Chryseobacterium koreense CCUG 49689]MBB5332685.1 hypothetical protein [Chryseobacterium koreense]
MKKIFLLGSAFFAFLVIRAQVGINTQTPTTTFQIEGKSPATQVEGAIVPRYTGDQVYAMPIYPGAPNQVTTVSQDNEANLVYVTSAASAANNIKGERGEFLTTSGFFFWDPNSGNVDATSPTGKKGQWRRLFVASRTASGNDGVVKVNSGVGGAKPTLSLGPAGNTYGPRQQILYTTPLVFADFPTTSWPENTIPYPGVTANIYTGTTAGTQRWRENPIEGQVHIWRLLVTITAGNNSNGSVKATFLNPDSGFEINSIALIPSGTSGLAKPLTFYFYTIADPQSIPVGKGYQLFLESDISSTIVVDSFTRISLFKD